MEIDTSRGTSQPTPAVQSLRRPSIIDQAEVELRRAIFEGTLRPGDSIPEVQVSSQMGISRSSLREACQRLVRDGLLTQFRGRGLFVTELDPPALLDLLDYRRAVELQAVSTVAQRVRALREQGDDDAAAALLDPARRALEEMSSSLSAGDLLAAGSADLALHQMLAEATGNRFLIDAMGTIMILTRLGSFCDPAGFGIAADLPGPHASLLNALEDGDAAAARAALEASLHELSSRLRTGKHGELLRDPHPSQPRDPAFPVITDSGPTV